ncbi:hypothetical protein LEP1GSC074_3266 [Leptospira noguchii str. Hook]|nr:hypothetical protein LEP1GSC041_0451 [Leptospira noguchii str. 2006001870]EMS82064.1 hypothetical protein LEP1GSC074_3266 [Leptospira noguchii str. Hook]EMS87518.1 hypothetical protein LEP1GSC073_2951 [Leptospira noguchii str. Cascata]
MPADFTAVPKFKLCFIEKIKHINSTTHLAGITLFQFRDSVFILISVSDRFEILNGKYF